MPSTQHNNSHNVPGPRRIPTTGEEPVVIDSGPDGLIAAVPGLLGFTPTRSMVIVGLTAHDGRLESVGPVVRTDVVGSAAAAGAEALGRALYDMPDAAAALILVAPEAWPMSGRVVDVLTAALSALVHRAVKVDRVYVLDEIRAGARWRGIVPDGNGNGWVVAEEGSVEDPACSPVLSAAGQVDQDTSRSSDSMHRDLDKVDKVDDELAGCLPQSWFTGVTAADRVDQLALLSPADVCFMVSAIREESEEWSPSGGHPLDVARREVRRALRQPFGAGERIFEFCTRADLFPTLVVLGAGRASTVVKALLLEAATLGRSSLRTRALLLIALLGWCGNHGALGHRAARRCMDDMWDDDGADTDLSRPESEGRLCADMLTLSLAGVLCEGVSDGSAPRLVAGIVSQGVGHVEREISLARDDGQRELAGTLERVLDQAAVSAVRSALDRRAGR